MNISKIITKIDNRIISLISTIIIAIIIMGIIIILLIPDPADVKIISVNYEKEENTGIYNFVVEIKNIGEQSTDYTVSLFNYRVGEGITGHLDDVDECKGFLDAGDKTVVYLSTEPVGTYILFDIEIKVYSNGYTDSWYKRIER